ncbi:MAG: TRAP transporter permease [Deltaproteobacteria bacterium]|nr:TRAP transporter permease [Deltaproteobacteria bacterium]
MSSPGLRLRLKRNFIMKHLISGICVALVLFHTATAGIILVPEFIQRTVHITLVLVLAFLLRPFVKRVDGRLSFFSWIPVVISVLTGLYIVVFNNDIMFSQGMLSMEMIVIGWVMILLVLELTRRVTGWVLTLIAAVAVLYPLFGKYLPGLIGHRGYTMGRISSTLGLSLEGIFGAPLGASAEFVVLFIFLAALLNQCGMGQYLLKLALSMTGRLTGGPAKTAVIASALFGSISGSSVANVAGTGTFTIPMMKKQGFPAHIAGAVESVASTGGQIMPPIMGAAAFIMAQILNVSYVDVVKAAIIPALLYFTSVFMSIHFHALRLNIKPLDASDVPSFWKTLKEGWHYLVPLVVLIVLMVVVRYTVTLSVLWSIAATFIVTWFNRESRITWSKFVKACVDAGENVLTVAAACAAAGLVIGSINLTGIGFKLFSLIMGLTGGIMILVLIYTMFGSIVMGMGVPTTAAYIVVAVTCAPVLVDFGLSPMAAHMFVFYFAILSAITPPVALAAYAAAGLAGARPMKIAWASVGLGISAFLVPFIFVYSPQLLGEGAPLRVLLACVTAIVGVTAISAASIGFFFMAPLKWLERILLAGGGLILIIPGILTDMIGLGLVSIVLFLNYVRKKSS